MPDAPLYSWIHLSDIHFGHGSPAWKVDQSDVVDKLLGDVRTTLDMAGVTSPDAVLLTGDIAFSGRTEEFEYALRLLDRLRAEVGADPRVLVVAGNHDVVRTEKSDLSAMRLLKELRGGGDVDGSVRHGPDRQLLEHRFEGFRRFCEEVGSPVAITQGWAEIVDLGPARLRFVGWNTGLLSNDNQERGVLAVPLASSIESLLRRSSNDITIVLTHHNVDWLQAAQRNALRGHMWTRGANLHLSGHEHDPALMQGTNSRGESLISISAGAVHADQDTGWAQTEHFYSVGRVVGVGGEVRLDVFPRRFSTKSRTWGIDYDSVQESPFCSFTLTSADETALRDHLHGNEPFAERMRILGRRRTTFPTDLSTAEVVRMELVVPARSTRGELVLDRLLGASGDSVLVLGDPGAGKTILAYSFARRLLDEGRLPLTVDIREVGTEWQTLDELLISQLGTSVSAEDLDKVSIVVDGLDEALGSGMEPEEIQRRTMQLRDVAPVVAFCRKRDYNTRLGAWLRDFPDQVMELAQWTFADFADYLGRLRAAGEIGTQDLLQRVEADPRLASLVARPLLARMLTLVATSEDGTLPSDISTLYSAYLRRVAEFADAAMGTVPPQRAVAMEVWLRVAWEMFAAHERGVDSFLPEDVLEAASSPDLGADLAFRAIETIMDVDASGRTVSFIHYSMFEFLVAQTVADRLIGFAPKGSASAAQVLARDLPGEIRRHLVSLLRADTSLPAHRWPAYLADIYRAARGLDSPGNLTACNLVVYILCRLGINVEGALLALLEDERDPFLRNSIHWALARIDHREATNAYLGALVEDPGFASMNRGYLLYYYGDIGEAEGPPFVDGGGSWQNTRDKVLKKLGGVEYSSVPTSRRLVDVFTFADLATTRGERLDLQELGYLERALEGVQPDESTALSLKIVREALGKVGP